MPIFTIRHALTSPHKYSIFETILLIPFVGDTATYW